MNPTFLSKYKVRKLYTDTYSIADYGMDQGAVFMYLLVGSERALLVDSGYGGIDLPAVIRKITDKEVICLCTHGHIDHACGAYHFEKAYLHTADFDIYRKWCSAQAIREHAVSGIAFQPTADQLADPRYRALIDCLADKPRHALLPLDGIKEFDLGGGRIVSWFPVPGHTRGSVAVIDKKYKVAFDSDGVASGVWLFLPESTTVAEYRDTVAKYQAFLRANSIEKHYTGHMARCLGTRRNEDLLACCDTILEGRKLPYSVNMLAGAAKLMLSHDVLVFYTR